MCPEHIAVPLEMHARTYILVILGWVALGLLIQSVVFALPNVILSLTTCVAMVFRKHLSKK